MRASTRHSDPFPCGLGVFGPEVWLALIRTQGSPEGICDR